MEKVNRNEPLKPLAGEQLDYFNESIKKMSLSKLKTARQSMNGIYRMMKLTDLRRLLKNSQKPEQQEKYAQYLKDMEKYESQVAMFDYHIKLLKESDGGLKDDEKERMDQ